MRKETGVSGLISFPIHAPECRIIELIQDLTPSVVEDISTLLCRTISELGLESDRFFLAILQLYLFQFAAGGKIEVLYFLIGE